MNISIIIEGGLVRGAYVDGQYVDADVLDFDVLDGGDEDEIEDLIAGVQALPEGTDLKRDAMSYLPEEV